MKRKWCILLALCFTLLFAGCNGGYRHPKFKTKYTIEEHIQKISKRTEEIFAEEITNGNIANYTIEIIYAFYDEDPEYFLVELEYAEEWESQYENPDFQYGEKPQYIKYSTKNKHFIGFIENDEYYTGLPCYDSGASDIKQDCFMDGKSGYALCAFPQNKKYYGAGIQGVQVGEQIIICAHTDCFQYGNTEFHQHETKDVSDICMIGKTVDVKSYKGYMNGNYKLFRSIYKENGY